MKKFNPILIAAIHGILATPAVANDSDVFELGTVTVGAEKTKKIESNSIEAEEMRAHGDTNVGQAISRVPGVAIREGGRRAESQAAIRGFDSRQVTLNLDGIPIYLPYDGNIDLSRYLTADLSRIEVQKSLGSLLLGPNNMGGSINLVSRKPTKEFEGSATVGTEIGRDGVFSKFGNVQVGSRINDQLFISAGISKVSNDDFPLSTDFKPVENSFTNKVEQPKGNRLHSGSDSQTINFKAGYTPNETDEYVIGYHKVTGEKEAAPYAGTGVGLRPNQGKPAYWNWPQWDKQSLYFLSHTQLDKSYIKTRLYHDDFDNRLVIHDDDTYRTVTGNKPGRSQYDDRVFGGSIEAGHQFDNQLLKASFHVKKDEHKERDLNNDDRTFDNAWQTYQNEIYSFGLEDTIQLSHATKLTLGYRHDQYQVTKVDDGDPNTLPSDKQRANNFQIKAEHNLGEHTLFGGISKKTRYASIKEIYSYRMGQAIPNENLGSESALHYELGSLGKLGKVNYQANLFYSDIKDAIESVTLTSGPDSGKYQNQNVGTATHYGTELMINVPIGEQFRFDANYSYIDIELADKSLVSTRTPKHQALLTLNWFANNDLDLAIDWEKKSKRQTDTDGTRPTDGYGLWHFRAGYQINKTFSANAVLRNALDKNYQIYDGDPMMGRALLVNVNAKF